MHYTFLDIVSNLSVSPHMSELHNESVDIAKQATEKQDVDISYNHSLRHEK